MIAHSEGPAREREKRLVLRGHARASSTCKPRVDEGATPTLSANPIPQISSVICTSRKNAFLFANAHLSWRFSEASPCFSHQWLEESWDSYVPEELDEDYASMLLTLRFFASKKLAEGFREEAGGADLAYMAKTIASLFPDALAQYARLGRSIQQAIAEAEAGERPRRAQKKIGRNDPCPCGSGQKYKRCGGARPT